MTQLRVKAGDDPGETLEQRLEHGQAGLECGDPSCPLPRAESCGKAGSRQRPKDVQ
jgi:hypothetical protein